MLIHTTRTLVSAGTERMLVDFGKAGLIDKARQQPDKVRMVLDKIRTDGLMPTVEAVRNKLDQPNLRPRCTLLAPPEEAIRRSRAPVALKAGINTAPA